MNSYIVDEFQTTFQQNYAISQELINNILQKAQYESKKREVWF